MSHFSKKSFIFYGVAIGSVIALFSVVTAYGESHLTVAAPIYGKYQLRVSPQADCPNPEILDLAVQQSGVYVTATLQPESAANNPAANNPAANNPAANHSAPLKGPEPSALSGLWQRERLRLEGQGLEICPIATGAGTAADSQPVPLRIEAQLSQGQLTGSIVSDSVDRKLTFVGERALPPASASETSGHK
jgi:hypothetical protein